MSINITSDVPPPTDLDANERFRAVWFYLPCPQLLGVPDGFTISGLGESHKVGFACRGTPTLA